MTLARRTTCHRPFRRLLARELRWSAGCAAERRFPRIPVESAGRFFGCRLSSAARRRPHHQGRASGTPARGGSAGRGTRGTGATRSRHPSAVAKSIVRAGLLRHRRRWITRSLSSPLPSPGRDGCNGCLTGVRVLCEGLLDRPPGWRIDDHCEDDRQCGRSLGGPRCSRVRSATAGYCREEAHDGPAACRPFRASRASACG